MFARWLPWALLRMAMGEMNIIHLERACPSFTKHVWFDHHAATTTVIKRASTPAIGHSGVALNKWP